MKKVVVILLFGLLSFGLNAQEGFRIGIQGGLPIDDFNDEVSLMVGVDAGYMWVLGEAMDLGVTTGYIHGFSESFGLADMVIELPNVEFVPLATSLKFWPTREFSLGGNVGYALGISEGNDGGLYYRPMIGYLFNQTTEINFSYTGISLDDRSWTTISVGIVLTIQTKPNRL